MGFSSSRWLLSGFVLIGFTTHANECVDAINELIAGNQFTTTRNLLNYVNDLGEDFYSSLAKLRGNQHWIDAGSGEGYALYHLLDPGLFTERIRTGINKNLEAKTKFELAMLTSSRTDAKPRITGVSYKMTSEEKPRKNLRFLTGRYFEDIPNAELGRADLISDYYGVMAYTSRPDLALNKYMELLQENGSAYVFMGNFDEIKLCRVRTKDGRDISLVDWMCAVPGVDCKMTSTSRYLGFNHEVSRAARYTLRISKRKSVPFSGTPALEVIKSETLNMYTPAPIRYLREK